MIRQILCCKIGLKEALNYVRRVQGKVDLNPLCRRQMSQKSDLDERVVSICNKRPTLSSRKVIVRSSRSSSAYARCIHEVPKRYNLNTKEWEPLKWYWEPEMEKDMFYSTLAPFTKTKADAFKVLEVMMPKYLKWNLGFWGLIKLVGIWYGAYYVYKFFTADVMNSAIMGVVMSNFCHFNLAHLIFDVGLVSTLVAAHYRYTRNSYIWYVCIFGALSGPMMHNFLNLNQTVYKEQDRLDQIDYALITNRKDFYLPTENIPHVYPGVYNPGFGAAGISYSLLGSLVVMHAKKKVAFLPTSYILATTFWIDLMTYFLLPKQYCYVSAGTHLGGTLMGATIASIRQRCHLKIPLFLYR